MQGAQYGSIGSIPGPGIRFDMLHGSAKKKKKNDTRQISKRKKKQILFMHTEVS